MCHGDRIVVCLSVPMLSLFSQGLRNDFKDAFDKLDQEYLDQLAKQEVCLMCVCVCVCVSECVCLPKAFEGQVYSCEYMQTNYVVIQFILCSN